MNAGTARTVALGVLAVDAAALLLAAGIAVSRSDRGEVRPVRGVVVDSQCLEGRIVQGIDDGAPGGQLLARSTDVSC